MCIYFCKSMVYPFQPANPISPNWNRVATMPLYRPFPSAYTTRLVSVSTMSKTTPYIQYSFPLSPSTQKIFNKRNQRTVPSQYPTMYSHLFTLHATPIPAAVKGNSNPATNKAASMVGWFSMKFAWALWAQLNLKASTSVRAEGAYAAG
jgi:hypothetical protein